MHKGQTLTLTNVTKKFSTYMCKANNGIGKTAMTYYDVFVRFAPTVDVGDQMWSNAKEHLWCRVVGMQSINLKYSFIIRHSKSTGSIKKICHSCSKEETMVFACTLAIVVVVLRVNYVASVRGFQSF